MQQQQVIQQHHINVMLQKSQQLQQQSLHQQQQQHPQMLHHGTPNMTVPSPQHPAASSPSTQMLGRSPNPSGSRNTSTPGASMPHINIKQLVESFPKLLEMKQAGRLAPEQEKLVNLTLDAPMSLTVRSSRLSSIRRKVELSSTVSKHIRLP